MKHFNTLRDKAILHTSLLDIYWKDLNPTERTTLLKMMMKHDLALVVRSTDAPIASKCEHGIRSSECIKCLQRDISTKIISIKIFHDPNIIFTPDSHAQFLIPVMLPEKDGNGACTFVPVANNDTYVEVYFVFSNEELDEASHGNFFTVEQLEQLGTLPANIFTYVTVSMVQNMQYTHRLSASQLFKTFIEVYVGPVKLQLELVPHICAIRVRIFNNMAAKNIFRLQKDLFEPIIAAHFPQIKMTVLLPGPGKLNALLRLHAVLNVNMVSLIVPPTLVPELPSGRVVTLTELRESYGAIFPRRGNKFHYMVSYRQYCNRSSFASKLVDSLSLVYSQKDVDQNKYNIPLQGFFDLDNLTTGQNFTLEFSLGLVNALVALPVISIQAMQRMVHLQAKGLVDNVLIEWKLMLQAHTFTGGGRDDPLIRLRRIAPLILGDQWADDDNVKKEHDRDRKEWTDLLAQHTTNISDEAKYNAVIKALEPTNLKSSSSIFAAMTTWIDTYLPDSLSPATDDRLDDIVFQLQLRKIFPVGYKPLTVRKVVKSLLLFNVAGINCTSIAPAATASNVLVLPPSVLPPSTVPVPAVEISLLFEDLSNSIRMVVDEVLDYEKALFTYHRSADDVVTAKFDDILSSLFEKLHINTDHQRLFLRNGITLASVLTEMTLDDLVTLGIPSEEAQHSFVETLIPRARDRIQFQKTAGMSVGFDDILHSLFQELKITSNFQNMFLQQGITLASVVIKMTLDDFVEMGIPKFAARVVFVERLIPDAKARLASGGRTDILAN